MVTLPIANAAIEPDAAGPTKMMRALVYLEPGKVALQERPVPQIAVATDAIVRVRKTTICGSDLQIVNGNVPTCAPGRILGHEGVGTVEEIGSDVTGFKVGDHVVISCISSCGTCEYCRRSEFAHCSTGGWILGREIDGTQAEYVRIPHADTSLYAMPAGADEEALVMLSDILPTVFECGILPGKVQAGATVAIVGTGAIGLAALLVAKLHAPAAIIAIDTDNHRLIVAGRFGATHTINSSDGTAAEQVKALTGGRGADTAIDAVDAPETLQLCEEIVAPGGAVAAIGVHGDTVSTPMLLQAIQAQKLDPKPLISHHFRLRRGEEAYDLFARSAKTQALKVIISP